MTKTREQNVESAAVASVIEVIGKLTGDEPLASDGAAKKAAVVPRTKTSRKLPTTPE